MNEYFEEMHKALKEFHAWDERQANPHLKPLYMLIKVEVDSDYINNQQAADEYAEDFGVDNECVIVDTYYPDTPQYPYIAR